MPKTMPESSNDIKPTEIRLTKEQFNRIATEQLPFVQLMGLELEQINADNVLMRARYSDTHLRPGGTISGPVMMTLADAAVYALVLSRIGPVELTVTTNLSINFLRKPPPGDLLARATMLKLGSRLAVAEVSVHSERDEEMVAHVTSTYSIPPIRREG